MIFNLNCNLHGFLKKMHLRYQATLECKLDAKDFGNKLEDTFEQIEKDAMGKTLY